MASRQFFGGHENKLDAKNRVSIPAAFRAVLRDVNAQKLVLRPSREHPSIEAWPDVYFAELEARDVPADELDDWEWATYAGAVETEPDRDGRVILNNEMIDWAGLSEAVSVVGLGKRFEIWDRTAAKARTQAIMGMRPRDRAAHPSQP